MISAEPGNGQRRTPNATIACDPNGGRSFMARDAYMCLVDRDGNTVLVSAG